MEGGALKKVHPHPSPARSQPRRPVPVALGCHGGLVIFAATTNPATGDDITSQSRLELIISGLTHLRLAKPRRSARNRRKQPPGQ